MNEVILKVENLSKQYRLGTVGTGTISHDINRWWFKIRGKEDPYLKIGETNDRASKGKSDYVWALKDINFEVKQGEVLGIIGKNGAGKSTLLKILAKVTGPSTGSIKYNGRIASLLEVGTGFHPEMTGKENVFLNGAILGMTKKEISSKLDEIVEFSGCERYIDTPVKRYSSGMKVRLAFAVAAFLEPDILIVDEVLAVGDDEFQKKAIGKMKDISSEGGRTVLFVSHNMAAVKNLCTRCVVLKNGQVDFINDTDLCIEHYLNNYLDRNLLFNDTSIKLGVTKVNFFDKKDIALKSIAVGQELYIKVTYLNPEKLDLSISFAVCDAFGDFLFSCRSDVINVRYSEDKAIATLHINKWPLSEGRYYYNLLVHHKNTQLQFIQEAGFIDVDKGDYYGYGKLPGRKKSFYIDYEWK